jgi:uncharacterized protein with von Willebrand factor type A (vWA) domain
VLEILQISLPVAATLLAAWFAYRGQRDVASLQREQARREHDAAQVNEVLTWQKNELDRVRAELETCKAGLEDIAALQAAKKIAEYQATRMQRELEAAHRVATDQEIKLAEALGKLEERYLEVMALREQLHGVQAEVQLQSIRYGINTDQMQARLDYYRHLARRDKDATKELRPERLNGPDDRDNN